MFSVPNREGALPEEGLDPLLMRLRDKLPRPLVFTDGVFDLLHAGHLACLDEARRHGRSLVVGIRSDASLSKICKRAGLPLNSGVDRARVVSALSSVSAVVLFDEERPLGLMRGLAPQVYVKAGEADEIAGLELSRLLALWGGRTVVVPRLPNLSTSALVERWLAQQDGSSPLS